MTLIERLRERQGSVPVGCDKDGEVVFGDDHDALQAAAELEANAAEKGRLREAMEEARKAIATLDEDSLGFAMVPATNEGGNGYAYPIRDELLAQIDAALNKQESGNV